MMASPSSHSSTEDLIRINFRNAADKEKGSVTNTFGCGAGSEFLPFNRNLRGHVLLLLFVCWVSMATITDKTPGVFLMRPACPTCGSGMLLVRSFPNKPGHDQHTYECPRCTDEITEIVQFEKMDAFY